MPRAAKKPLRVPSLVGILLFNVGYVIVKLFTVLAVTDTDWLLGGILQGQ